jgi:predicted molibdopterin-dependent oxidoreductase YjgC
VPEGVILDIPALDRLAETIKQYDNIHVISGTGFFSHPDRDAFLSAMAALKKSCDAKLSIVPVQSNFMGVSRFGLYGRPGHSFPDILEKINNGSIKALFVFGSNPVEEYPDRKYVLDTLKKLEFLMVVTPFMSSLTDHASLVFPQALPSDYSGTFMNMEGRIQKFEAGPENPHYGRRPVWSILGEFSDLLELESFWYHDSQIREEIAKNLSKYSNITNIPTSGLLIDLIEKRDFNVEDVSPEIPAKGGSDLPYLLSWTPAVHHNGWITEKSATLMNINGKQVAWMNPGDAQKEGIEAGQVVRIGNTETGINIAVKVTKDVNKGEILIVNSFEKNPVNRLMNRDEKTTFVSVRKT